MNNIASCLAIILILTSQIVSANEQISTPIYKVSIKQGITHEDFSWSIDGIPPPKYERFTKVNILSELQWRNMEIHQTELNLEIVNKRILLALNASHGLISSGENQDSDYADDNRQNEFQRSYSDINGETLKLNLALGYELPLLSNKVTLTPKFGLLKHEQKLGQRNGTTVISDYDIDNNVSIASNIPITGLDSSYDTDWNTKWLGAKLQWHLTPNTEIGFDYQYHFDIDYSAKANWNLRTDFEHPVSFIHESDKGKGHFLSLSSQYQFHPQWWLSLTYSYFRIEATDGIDITYFSNNTTGSTGLNIAKTTSNTLMLGLTWTPGE